MTRKVELRAVPREFPDGCVIPFTSGAPHDFGYADMVHQGYHEAHDKRRMTAQETVDMWRRFWGKGPWRFVAP